MVNSSASSTHHYVHVRRFLFYQSTSISWVFDSPSFKLSTNGESVCTSTPDFSGHLFPSTYTRLVIFALGKFNLEQSVKEAVGKQAGPTCQSQRIDVCLPLSSNIVIIGNIHSWISNHPIRSMPCYIQSLMSHYYFRPQRYVPSQKNPSRDAIGDRRLGRNQQIGSWFEHGVNGAAYGKGLPASKSQNIVENPVTITIIHHRYNRTGTSRKPER